MALCFWQSKAKFFLKLRKIRTGYKGYKARITKDTKEEIDDSADVKLIDLTCLSEKYKNGMYEIQISISK